MMQVDLVISADGGRVVLFRFSIAFFDGVIALARRLWSSRESDSLGHLGDGEGLPSAPDLGLGPGGEAHSSGRFG